MGELSASAEEQAAREKVPLPLLPAARLTTTLDGGKASDLAAATAQKAKVTLRAVKLFKARKAVAATPFPWCLVVAGLDSSPILQDYPDLTC